MRLLCSLAVSFFLISGSAFASPPKILKLSELKPGTKAIGFSVFQGIEPEPFDVELGEPTELMGLKLILGRLSGGPMATPLEKIGPVAGMSGSPIFIDCKNLQDCTDNGILVGALSYGLGYFIDGGMNFMITPAEFMLGARSGGYVASFEAGHAPSKILFKGREYKNLMLFPKMDTLTDGVGPSSRCPDSSKHSLKPGSMVSIYLAWGQIPIAASGTVTWVDDKVIYVFGHPLFGTGIVQFPFSQVSVAATLQTPAQPQKIAGCYLDTGGLMIVDGSYEVAGVIGGNAVMIPYQVDININGRKISFYEEFVDSPVVGSVIGILPSLWAQSIFGHLNGLSVAYQLRVAVKDEPEIFAKNIISSEVKTLESPFGQVLNRLNDIIFKDLESYDVMDRIEKIHLQVNFVSNLMTWKGKTSFLSQKTALPGETVYVNVVLEESSSGAIKQISIPVKIPNDFWDRSEAGEANLFNVFIQSGSKFADKKDSGFKRSSSMENAIKELNAVLNRQMNVLYVQQVMAKSKSDKEADRELAKSATKPQLKWSDIGPGELNLFPSKSNMEVVLSTTSTLDHFIDYDSSFSITVKQKEEAVKSETNQDQNKKKNRKWFFLF